MITPAYCVTLAQYNQWQNNSLREHVDAMNEADLRADRGLFFGSILATLDHIMWADLLWLNRLDDRFAVPTFPDKDAVISVSDWSNDRQALDSQIVEWAKSLTDADMVGDVVWESKIYGKTFTNDRGLAITHMFNHQTHHRGQVHAMLTKEGLKAPVSDLFAMPEDV